MGRFHVRILPWIVAGGALLFYLFTLNSWVTFGSLTMISKVTGWDWWSLSLQAPLFRVLTWPVRLLPGGLQPLALNLFSALCAAVTLGLLARSVSLLPHDRSRDQRQREGGEHALLSLKTAWLPCVFAALVGGLQLSFWEHATSATGEMLDLLLFAYVVRCLLEYRIDGHQGRLYRMAFVYGLAITNNWAMIGLFPAMLVALIWIQKARFLDGAYLLRMLACGAAGLTLYLLLPMLEKSGNGADMTFWQLFKGQLSLQKQMLFGIPKYILLLCGLSSLVPVCVMGFRFPSSFGDTSAVGSFLTHFLYRFIQGLLLGFCLYVAFDPPASPRQLGMGLAFLPAYYLGALSIGYFCGYFLLVYGVAPQTRFHRISAGTRLFNRAVVLVVWAAAVAVPVALAIHSYPGIRANNSRYLRDYATRLAAQLPKEGAILLSDEPWQLMLVEGISARQGVPHRNVLVDARSAALGYHVYQRNLARRYPGQWPDLLRKYNLPEPIDSSTLLTVMLDLARTNRIWYVNPSYGPFGEVFGFDPHGLTYELRSLPPAVVTNPAPSAALVDANLAFWREVKTELDGAPPKAKAGAKEINRSDADYVRGYYSRAANRLGAQLQRLGQLESAKQCFDWAAEFDPDNEVAKINRLFNENLRGGNAKPVELEPADEARLRARFPRPSDRLRQCGPCDEPRFCLEQGEAFAGHVPPLLRQAAQEFTRVRELNPGNLDAGIWLANMYLKWPLPDRVLEVVAQMEPGASQPPLGLNYQVELVQLKALAYAMTTNQHLAVQVLKEAHAKNPGVASLLDTLAQVYIGQRDLTNGVAALEEELRIDANNTSTRVKAGALYLRLQRFAEAIPHFTVALETDPKNDHARLYRGLANLQSGRLDDAEKDFTLALDVVGSVKVYRAWHGLGEVAWRRNDKAKALEYYRKFLATMPTDKQGKPIFVEEAGLHQTVLDRFKELGVTPSK